MTLSRLREVGLGPVGALLLGAVVGLGASQQPLLVALAAIGLVAMVAVLGAPPLLVVGMFVGILFDKLGVTGFKVAKFPITASKLSVLGALGAWGFYGLVTKVRAVRWHPVLSAMLVMVLASGITLAATGKLGDGRFVLFGLIMMTVLVGLVYAILSAFPMQPVYRILSVVVVLALGLTVLRGGGGAGEAARSTGTFGDPNEWATMVLLLVPTMLGGVASERGWFGRGLRMALVGLLPLAVLQAGSRTALVVLAAISPFLLAVLWRRRTELLAVVGAGALAAPFVVDGEVALRRFRSLWRNLTGEAVVGDQSLDERTELLHQGLDLFADNWLIGVGPGNFEKATGFVSVLGKLRPAHNTYLEIAAEQGIVGLIPALAFCAVIAWTLWVAWRTAPTRAHAERVLGVSAGLVALGLMAATLGLITFSMGYLVLGFSLAVVFHAAADRAALARAHQEAAHG